MHTAGRSPSRRLTVFLDCLEEHLTSSATPKGSVLRAAKGKLPKAYQAT
ncbi:hypothetical protein A176_000516 [Myxococcus hansupus]|uniref:Uncharacterized protein n=1 Tax=Pseudomyxococcus hansupus TaxID=1297742 RepID=A0A0H4WLK3_9BACT|nr:hypothetical protein A176_000516 [Myxococcus hansupus]